MNGDERFDQLLRSALDRQVAEAVRDAPSLERSVRRLAERLGPEPERVGPFVVARAGSGRSLQLMFALLLLLVLLAVAALAVGSQFLPRPEIEPPRFGYASGCFGPGTEEGVVYDAFVDEVPIVLYEDGLLVKVLNDPSDTRSAFFDGMGGLERRLSPRGIELILERVGETFPHPGCRHLRSQESTGEIRVFTPKGLVELSWHPTNSGRRLTVDEEAEAEALEQALAQPEAWLPPEAWLDATERPAAPDRWLVIVELTPSGFGPGDQVTLSTGRVLDGSDPRYAQVDLPDGQEPTEFGEQVANRDGTRVRCGILGTADARRLADSLDALPLAMHDEEELFTETLTTRVFIYFVTAYPREPDCVTFGRGIGSTSISTPVPPPPTFGPIDDLAGVDPCGLVPEAVREGFGDDVTLETRPSYLSLGIPARACFLVKADEFSFSRQHAALTLYPRSVDADAAAKIASSVHGGGLVEETIAGRPVWVNECLASALPCVGAVAAWSDPYVFVLEFYPASPGEAPETTLETARAIVESVLEGLRR